MKLKLLCAAACALPFISTISVAAPVISDPYYSAPGSYTRSTSGPPAQLGEQIRTFINFDDTAYGNLYYAFGDSGPIGVYDTFITAGPSLYADNTDAGEIKNPLAYNATDSNFASGLVVWSGTTTASLFGALTSLNTRFTMEITDTSNNPLALTDSALLGLDASLGGVLDVTSDFKVMLNALLQNTTGSSFSYNNGAGPVTCTVDAWCNALPVWDRLNGKSPSARLYTSYDNAFYSTPVPVPAAAWLFGSGLLGMIGIARRKKA